jgi:hypothetical protein
MNDGTLISEVGQTLWGSAWKGPMAKALQQQEDTVSDWARGRMPVPPDIWKELREVARLKALKIADLGQEIVQAYDAAVVRARDRGRTSR